MSLFCFESLTFATSIMPNYLRMVKKKKLKKIFLDTSRIASKSQKIHFETNLLQKDLFDNNKHLNVLLLINQSYKD